jgi:glycosyltransferase involved in cell wall biosynthesis
LFGGTTLLAPRISRPAPEARTEPLIVAGYFGARTGLGVAAERLARVLELAGCNPIKADLTGRLRQGSPVLHTRQAPPADTPPTAHAGEQPVPTANPRQPAQAGRLPHPGAVTPPAGTRPVAAAIPAGPGTLLVHVNGPMLPWAMLALGRRAVAGKRIIAVWNWELPILPADWQRGFRFAHQIWVASRFTAGAVTGPGRPPVAVVPYAVPEPDPAPLDRAAFGLPADAFVSLCVFDASSSIARKNPLAAIRAHHLAFGDRPDRILVLKTHYTAHAGAAWREVAETAAERPNVRVLDRTLDNRALWALQRAADVFLSLHRSEGFGMGIAEAMRIGRPVVATGWSGNMDFMHGEGAIAVPYDLVPARDPQDTYDMPETSWAEARTEDAAQALAMLAEEPDRRAAMGAAAAADIARLLAPEVVRERAWEVLAGPLGATDISGR